MPTRPEDPAFFDDDYLRLLAPFHPEPEARTETAALRELLGLSQDDRILDLGCGWARHLALLDEAGHDIIGVDLSLELLRHAARERPRPPRLVAADMRAVPLAGASFDAVLNIATSLGLFLDDDDALAALREVARLLRPGGLFLIEGMHRDDVEAHFAPTARWRLEDGTEVRARRTWDPERGISREILRWRGPAGEGEKRHALRVRSAPELARLVEEAGLEVVQLLGDWDAGGFGPHSERLILLASRPGPS